MNTLLTAIVVAALAALFAAPAAAQWPSHTTPNVPRKADGTPDLEGPTPRAADRHPDLSGLWEIYFNTIVAQTTPPQGPPPAPGDDPAEGLPPRAPEPPPGTPPIATFANIEANFKGGSAADALGRRVEEAAHGHQLSRTTPTRIVCRSGCMQFHTALAAAQVVHTARTRWIIIYRRSTNGLRQMFTDGREPHRTKTRPAALRGKATPSANGTATRSSSRRPDFAARGWLDVNGTPLHREGLKLDRAISAAPTTAVSRSI